LVGTRCEFEATERAVKEQRRVAMRAHLVVFINPLATRCTKCNTTLVAEAIFEEEWCTTTWAFAAEFRW
jgi:RNase P subunit RPR2